MGCAVSKSHKVTDSSILNNSTPVEVIRSGRNLLDYFTADNSDRPKCIFVFGGSGSQKGELVWELMQQNKADDDSFSLAYIDVQFLIASHIKNRVIELIGDVDISISPEPSDHLSLRIGDKKEPRADKEKEDEAEEEEDDEEDISDIGSNNNIQVDQVKPYLMEYSNIVSCSWVLSLIEAEIAEKCALSNESERESKRESNNRNPIFLINLLPNRMNLFKNCLYLKQTPNLSQCNFEYFAVNLVRHEHTKKDLDLVDEPSSFDEINLNFLNYFRNINKLVDLRISQSAAVNQLTIKLTRSKNAKKVSTPGELYDVLKTATSDLLELNVSMYTTSNKLRRHSSLLFFVDDQIDINDGEVLLLIDPQETNIDAIRHLTQSILEVKRSLRNSTTMVTNETTMVANET